ncbi:hypothetical protein R3W88_024546 [Solanum pinnatisectum]|uniref:Uncharacterized protein n=1 Tax=Solanum pinnatisectum TaxID=50273 RepID=A0AAV9M0H1_9SOLN|nr:hypothetical protein R3W88_024546 [Solanum pinnatisectum]
MANSAAGQPPVAGQALPLYSDISFPILQHPNSLPAKEDNNDGPSQVSLGKVDKTTNLKDEKLAQENKQLMLNQSSQISSNKEVDSKDGEQLTCTGVQQSTAIANVEYPIPLQMISTSPQESSDCTTMEHKEHLPIIPFTEKDSPMQDLHDIVSHQLHEVNISESTESRVDGVEDKDDHNNNINSRMIEREAGLSPHAISKGLKGKNKGENNKVENNGMITRTSLKRGVKTGVK